MKDGYVRVKCPGCDCRLLVGDRNREKQISCPACQSVFRLNLQPSKPGPSPVLRFQSIEVDPSEIAGDVHWAKPAPIPRSPANPGNSSAQKIRRHPGREVAQVVVKAPAPKPVYQSRRRSLQSMRRDENSLDESLSAIGVIFIFLGSFLGLFHLLNIDFQFLKRLDQTLPFLGMVIAAFGFVLLIYVHRDKTASSLLALSLLGIVVSGFIGAAKLVDGWPTSIANSGGELAEGSESQIADRRDDRLSIAGAGNVDGGAGVARADSEGAANEGPVSSSPAEDASRQRSDQSTSSADSQDPIVVDQHWNPFLIQSRNQTTNTVDGGKNATRPGAPATRSGSRRNDGNQNRSQDGSRSSDLKSPDKDSPSRRLTEFSTRSFSEMKNRWNQGARLTLQERQAFQSSPRFAGEVTAEGRVAGNGQPIAGVDFSLLFKASHLSPIYPGEAEMEQSLLFEGRLLSGLNLAFLDQHLVAVQGVFSLSDGNQLKASSRKTGHWVGKRETADREVQIASTGKFVTGLAIFRRDDTVVGIGLVVE